MHLRSILAFSVALATGSLAGAQQYSAGQLHIESPYARATVPHQKSGGAYVTLENKGNQADRLTGAITPVAESVEVHTMSMDGNVMKMREAGSIELKPSAKIEMKPGQGYHLMLIGLRQTLKAGDRFPLTLTFEKAGKVEVSVEVRDMSGKAGGHDNAHHGSAHHGH